MKIVKVLIAFIIIVGTGIGIAIVFLLNNEDVPVYTGLATVIERRSAKEVVVRLNEEPEEKISNELIVYSNIFSVNDQVEIEYSKKREKYIVNKVKAGANTSAKKTEFISKIASDPTMIKYSGMLGSISKETNIAVLPIQLFNQVFDLMSEIEFYNLKFNGINTIINKDESIIVTLLEDFKIVSLENITSEQRIFLPYTVNNQSINFKGIGEGIYSLKVSFKKQNIINYIFT